MTGRRTVLIAVLLLAQEALADDQVFDVSEIPVAGRAVSATVADFNGDQRGDLLVISSRGVPPQDTREILFYLQRENGGFSEQPDKTAPVPPGSAAYDVLDDDSGGKAELVFLRSDRLTFVSLHDGDIATRDRILGSPPTIAPSGDDRSLDPFSLVQRVGEETWLLIPRLGALSILTSSGDELGTLDALPRANYLFAERESLLILESDIQVFLDVPRTSIADVNGDGSADVVLATRHELRLFERQADGRFPSQPTETFPLDMMSETDHLRGSGTVVSTVEDYDNDGLADLLVTQVAGSLLDTITRTFIYKNRNGRWDLSNPDHHFVDNKTLSSDLLLNIDRDEQLELVRIQLKFTLLELVELLLQRKVDAVVAVHDVDAEGQFTEDPWSRKKISTGFDFSTFRPKGFMPRGEIDLNADGLMDFITPANGNGIEIFLGGKRGPFRKRDAKQEFNSSGDIRFTDIDANGLPDFVLFDTQTAGTPILIGINKGTLGGSFNRAVPRQ